MNCPAENIQITEIDAKYTLLSENSSGALYLIEPDEDVECGDAVLLRLRLQVNPDLSPREIEVMSGGSWASEMPDPMRELYDQAMKK